MLNLQYQRYTRYTLGRWTSEPRPHSRAIAGLDGGQRGGLSILGIGRKWAASSPPPLGEHSEASTARSAHGCDAPRLDAPATDEATLKALHDFYSRADTLI